MFLTAAKMTAVVMFLVAAALVSAWLITDRRPAAVRSPSCSQPLMGNQTLLLIAIMVLVVIVGTAMDMTPTILILTPVLMPVVKEAGIDPIYFGVLFIINNSIGLITPPVGTVLNVVAGVSQDQHGRPDEGRLAVHAGAARRAVPDGAVPAACHVARQIDRRIAGDSSQPRCRAPTNHPEKR